MPRPRPLLISPATIPSPHDPPTVHFCSSLISHPLPSAQTPFPPSFSAASPLSTAFTPNRPLTPLSTAFTQTHRGVGGHESPITAHLSRFLPALCFHALTNCFSRLPAGLLAGNPFIFTTIPICHRVSPVPVNSSPRITSHESQVTSFQLLAHSLSLLQLFFKLQSFVFNRLRTLRQKHPGGGYPGWWGFQAFRNFSFLRARPCRTSPAGPSTAIRHWISTQEGDCSNTGR